MSDILNFNGSNPKGHYELTLENPMQYAVAERIFMLCTWESENAKRRGRLDISQGGNYSAIRNFHVSGNSQLHDMEWEIGGDGYTGSGALVFDYVTPILPTSKNKPLCDELCDYILQVQETAVASEAARFTALRLVAHRMFLNAKQ